MQRQETSYKTATPTLDTGAYADGDYMGTVLSFPVPKEATSIKINSAVIVDKADQGIALNLILFNSLPTIASADNAALALADDQLEKFAGSIAFAAADYIDATNGKAVLKGGLNLGVQPDTDTKYFYAILQAKGAGTFAADSIDVKLYYDIEAGY